MTRFITAFVSLVLVFAFAGSSAFAAPKTIKWDDLVPSANASKAVDYSALKSTIGMPTLADFAGNQEDFDYYMETLDSVKSMQPEGGNAMAMNLDGKEIKMAGYVTPMSFEGDKVVEFLLVPYHGACIHVPPPPANQIIYVEEAKGMTASALWEPIYLIGKLRASPVATTVANVGYTVKQARIVPYDGQRAEPRKLIEMTQ